MMKNLSTALVVVSLVSVNEAAYVSPPTAPAPGPYSGYYRTAFPAAKQVLDPLYYQQVLSGFTQCITHQCATLPSEYTSTPAESLETVATYTSCVTSCAASEMMRVTVDFKGLIGKLIDIGSSQLAESHKYLAGQGDFDVLESNTHIRDSCCLPNDYFVPFEELVFMANVKFSSDSDYAEAPTQFISVASYLEYCTQEDNGEDNKLYLDKMNIECSKDWTKYFHEMKKNIGHLILAPKCKSLAPSGACSKTLDSNPQADAFGEAMCVAYEFTKNGKREVITSPILKYPIAVINYADSCPPSESDSGNTEILYRRVPMEHVPFFTLAGGLPSEVEDVDLEEFEIGKKFPTQCLYETALVEADGNRYTMATSVPDWQVRKAMYKCPRNGRFEYCNMKQYVNWLQEQLFDVSGCPLATRSFLSDDDDVQEDIPTDSPYAYYTLACLYRVISLKCDCMEAVLNCYEHEYKFSTSIGKTLGKAASVLCGFILCQKPKVYALLGGQRAISRSNIMKQVLMQVGALTSDGASGFPPVTFAFLSFGLGMVAFMVTKKVIVSKSAVAVEDGYRNLI